MTTAPVIHAENNGTRAEPAGVTEAGRRQALDTLRMAGAMCDYAGQLLGGRAVPASAVIADTAAELARVAVVLSRLAPAQGRLSRADHICLLAARGVPRADIARATGVPGRVVADVLDGPG